VRRRIVEAGGGSRPAPRAFTGGRPSDDFDDEEGPPSSVNVGRALASLRAAELRRLDAILGADEEEEEVAPAAVPVAPPPPPSVAVGKEIALADLAAQMGMSAKDLAAALVVRGFYSLTAKTVVARDTARLIAETYGFQMTDAPETEAPASAPAKKPKKTAARAKANAKANVAAKADAKARSKSSALMRTVSAKARRPNVQKSAKGRKR
jgi:hypothetical protein